MLARSTLVTIALLASVACANRPSPASSPNDQSARATAAASPVGEQVDPSMGEPPTQLLSLASPVAGPARDELPEVPVRPVERSLIDLTQLTQVPTLEVDARGHQSKIRALSFSHDGRYLVSAGYDKTIRVWSATTGELVRTLRGEIGAGPGGRIYTSALSSGGELLAVGGWLGRYGDRTQVASRAEATSVAILDFYTGDTLRLLEGHYDVVLSLAFSHRGRRLASGGGDRQVRLWDANTGRLERTLAGHSASVTSVAFSPDDTRIASASLDRTARIWDSITGRLVNTLSGHTEPVQAVDFTADGRYIVTASLDRTVRLWDGHTGDFVKLLAQAQSGISTFALSPDGSRLVTGCADAPFENLVVTIPDGKITTRFKGHDNIVLATAISPNGRWAATAGGSDYGVALWDIRSSQEEIHMAGHGATVWSVGFSSDGNGIAWGTRFDRAGASDYQFNGPLQYSYRLGLGGIPAGKGPDLGSDTGYVRAQTRVGTLALSTPTGREHSVLKLRQNERSLCQIRRDETSGFDHRSYGLAPDGRTLVSGGANGTLAAYDTRNCMKTRDFVGHTGDVLALALSPDSRYLVSGSADQTVRLWDLASGNLLMSLFHARNGQWVAFTPAGYYASSAYGDAYLGWHVNRGPAQSASYYPVTSLGQDFRNPEVVTRSLQNQGDVAGALAAYNRDLSGGRPKSIFRRFEELPQFAPPSIYYLAPGADTSVASDRIEVSAKAFSASNEPITEIFFLVNGRRVDERWWQSVGRPRIGYHDRYAEIVATLPLPQTVNRISVLAKNRLNASPPESIEIRRKGGPGELERIYRPDLYVLSVGISAYTDPTLQPLRYAHLDAGAVVAALQQQAGKIYGRVVARQLVDQQASQAALRDGLRWLNQVATQKDLAVIFLAGHAVMDARGNYYFVPIGGSLSSLETSAIRWSEFQAVLDALPSKVVLLADTCHGGSITGKSELARGARVAHDFSEALRMNLAGGSGIVVMTASTGVEDSFESDRWKHGAFTKALLDGLSGQADYDRDRSIYIRELDHYLTKRVNQLTEGRQHPTTEVPRSMPNFPIFSR